MDLEIQIKYRSLLVHHLEKEEVEFELEIRAVQFEKEESLSVLRRRLREKLKRERGDPEEVDFGVCETRTVDGEINLIDGKLKEISDCLEKKKEYGGLRDALGTRLVHYFARCSAIQSAAEEENDLEDLDKLLGTARRLYTSYFTLFSPIESIRKEVMLQITNSLTQLQLGQAGSSKVQQVSQETQTEDTEGEGHANEGSRQWNSGNSQQRRQLRSNVDQPGSNLLGGLPSLGQPSGARNPKKAKERILNKFDLSGRNPPRNLEVVDSDPVSDSSSSASPPRRPKSRPRRSNTRRTKPVSDWNLRRYDGRDGGQGLMRFIKEVEFFAKSENVSDRELFRSAIHLFSGLAKVWFMQGVENEDFTSWQELVTEMKKEFLGPDHDHVSEFRAIERKQRPKEKFQDFFFDIQRMFNSLTKPISEKKKFEIVFRNLRADYKGHVVAAQIDNLADLKPFGRKLDATFWYKYENRNQEEQAPRNRNQVSELRSEWKAKSGREEGRAGKGRPDQKPSENSDKVKGDRKSAGDNPSADDTKVDKGLKVLLEKYVPPKPGMCFNCRLPGHHQSECERPKHKVCYKCGFHNVETKSCPYCAKNA